MVWQVGGLFKDLELEQGGGVTSRVILTNYLMCIKINSCFCFFQQILQKGDFPKIYLSSPLPAPLSPNLLPPAPSPGWAPVPTLPPDYEGVF